ncbi:MAG: glycosyl hydrolase, partial [Acidobacteria bacterium]|nr:glycosyl hydrolase [Acidobacteriota bacterium]
MKDSRGLWRQAGILLASILILFGALPADSQERAKPKYDPALFSGMRWRLIGPFRGGRSIAVAGVVSDPHTYYMGAVGGGVWKTTNGGNTWTPLTDKWTVSSIGSIAVADSDPNVVYVGTGESCIRSNISPGDGMYKSTDAGKTWKHIGLRETQAISKIVVHPKNADIVYVAALGHPWGANAERGVFRTMDGGKTWEKVLYKDDKTGAIDIAMDPNNSTILFAALWEGWRTPWGMNSGGPNSALYKSTDSGSTWKQIQGRGWPEGIVGKIGVDVSKADSNRVYVILEALEEKGGVYVSNDGGNSWTHPTDDHRLRHRPWYYTHVAADPQEVNTMYVLNTGVFKSTDGGKTFAPLGGIPHGDHHDFWIDPNNNKRLVDANDGGATVSIDGGQSWTREDTLPTAQFYHITADNDWPYRICGAQQDNSSVCIRSRSDRGTIGPWDWGPVGGGEAGYISVDPKNPDIVYAGEYYGILTRFDRRTGQAQNVSVWPDNTDGWGAETLKYRFQWTMPILVSRFDPSVVYYTGNVVFRTTNGGMSWDVLSPDLTRNDKTKQQRSGGPITGENISMEYYNLIFSFAESPLDKNVLWAGADDGLIHVSRDFGKTWTNVTPKDMPEGRVSQLDASPHDPGTAYIALDRHEFDDFKPYVWKTSDFGKTWKQIGTGISETAFVRAVREDPKRKGLLFAGTETGVWVSFDDGANWQGLQLNLPVSPIRDLIVKDDDLAVATHGRAFWILDDISPLRQMSDEIAKSDVHVFTPSTAIRVRGGGSRGGAFTGANPPAGAQIYYYLKAEQKEEITLDILDAAGKVVRKFSSKPKPSEELALQQAQMGGRRG